MYGYDQSQLFGYRHSQLLVFDDAEVNGVGATAYATQAHANPSHKLHLISDPEELAIVQKYGLQDTPMVSRNIHR